MSDSLVKGDSGATIADNSKVTLNFRLRLENGNEIDSNFDRAPVSFKMGDGSLLRGFEEVLYGLAENEEKSFLISPENAFGQPNDENVQRLPRQSFSDMTLEEGLVISFREPSGTELPGVVKRYDDNNVFVDFNHPLAGRSIHFDVKVHKIEPAV